MSRDPGVSEARLGALGRVLRLPDLEPLHVGYGRAEEDCRRLAFELRRTIPRRRLEAAVFRPIPRSGLIVLGMLAYHLGLAARHLTRSTGGAAQEDPRAPLVLVDDCALSGLRLRQELEGVRRQGWEGPVVVAHLYSPPALRRAVLDAESRVVACVAAHDLEDRSAELFPDEGKRRDWRRRWENRLADEGRYWIGWPRPVSFAWSEPDRAFWNPETGRVEKGWHLEAPHRCLDARARLAEGLPAVAAQGGDGGHWVLPRGVAWAWFEEELYFCRLGDGEVFSLEGSAALVWRVMVTGGDRSAALAALLVTYEVEEEVARRDLDGLLEELEEAGLLVRCGERTDPDAERPGVGR